VRRKAAVGVGHRQAVSLVAQAEAMEMGMLLSVGTGPAVRDTLDRGVVPLVDLSRVATSHAGIAHQANDLKTFGGEAIHRGTDGLALLGGAVRSSGEGISAGKERPVEGPKGNVQLGGSSATAPVPDVDRVIAGLRPRFRQCYQTGLSSEPSMSGKLVVVAKVGPNGEVPDATISSNAGLSQGVAACIANVVKRAQFNPPGGGGSTVSIPVTFVQQ
jgi:hypothetical protein